MALSDPQLESRLKNIESTIEQRFVSNEAKINEFVDKLSSMLKMIEDNDTNVKSEVNIKFDTQEKNMGKMSAELTSGVTVNQAVASASVKNLEDNAHTIKNTLNNQTGRLGQNEIDSQSVASRIGMIESSINTLQAQTINELNSLKAQMSTVPNIAGAGQREEYNKLKPITEYKAISELASLGKDKTMYRDWNIKLEDALEQIYKNEEFIEIMDYIENTSTVISGTSRVKEIMDDAEGDAVLVKNEEWHKLAGHLKSNLLQK